MTNTVPPAEKALNLRLADLTRMFNSEAIDLVNTLTIPAALVDFMLKKIRDQQHELEEVKEDVATLKRQEERGKKSWKSVVILGPAGQSYGVAANCDGNLTICSKGPGKTEWDHGVQPAGDAWTTILGGNRSFTVSCEKVPQIDPSKPAGRG